jgi:hypothetical protein
MIYHAGRSGLGKLFVAVLLGCGLFWPILTTPVRAEKAVPAWVAKYKAPGSDSASGVDLVVDRDGYVYVTGTSAGSNGSDDILTLKYSPTGEKLWEAFYNGPGDSYDYPRRLKLDAEGNVYVTGTSVGTEFVEIVTIKYSNQGEELRVARYHKPGGGHAGGVDLALDGKGNVYVTGYTDVVPSGPEDWVTLKYNGNLDQLNVAFYNGPGSGDDRPSALALDGHGNVYVTGGSVGSGTGNDFTTIKYGADLTELIVARYNGPGNGDDYATFLTLDKQGHPIVTGTSWGGEATKMDFATIKYDSSLEEQWVRRYDGPAHDNDNMLGGLEADQQGNICISGQSPGVGSADDYATLKYDPDGNQLWCQRYSSLPSAYAGDMPHGLALDGQGNVYVTGESWNGEATGTDAVTLKYRPDGRLAWLARYHAGDYDQPRAIKVDPQGKVYLTGEGGNFNYWDCTTIKYQQVGDTPLLLLLE